MPSRNRFIVGGLIAIYLLAVIVFATMNRCRHDAAPPIQPEIVPVAHYDRCVFNTCNGIHVEGNDNSIDGRRKAGDVSENSTQQRTGEPDNSVTPPPTFNLDDDAKIDERLRRLFDAIVQIESGGDCSAVNEEEGAFGPAQIRMVMMRDVNRILGEPKYTGRNLYDLDESRRIFRVFCLHYYPDGTEEQWARAWNGGPRGPAKASTTDYWRKVEAELNR